MGYQIRYDETRGKQRHFTARLGVGLLVLGLLASCLWPRWADQLRQVVFPGDAAVTAAAMEELSQDLKTGVPLPQAWRQFCQSILGNEDFR